MFSKILDFMIIFRAITDSRAGGWLSHARRQAVLGQAAQRAGFLATQKILLLEDGSAMSHFSRIRTNVESR